MNNAPGARMFDSLGICNDPASPVHVFSTAGRR